MFSLLKFVYWNDHIFFYNAEHILKWNDSFNFIFYSVDISIHFIDVEQMRVPMEIKKYASEDSEWDLLLLLNLLLGSSMEKVWTAVRYMLSIS